VKYLAATILILTYTLPAFSAPEYNPTFFTPKAIVRSVTVGSASLLKLSDLQTGVFLLEVTPSGVVTLSGPYTLLNIGPGPGPEPNPTPSNLKAKLTAEVSKITAADRVATAATLNQALTATVAAAKVGTVTQAQVIMVLGMLGPTMPTWAAFLSILSEAVKATATPATLGDTIQVAVDVLETVK
jgi:hypothetical protein